MQSNGLIKEGMSFGDARKLWESPDLLDLDEGRISEILMEKMDRSYLIERGLHDVLKTLRQKYRRGAKVTTEERRAQKDQKEREEKQRAEMPSLAVAFKNLVDFCKEEGKREAWAEMDKWRIKQKPLRLVSYDELLDERDKDQSSADGMLANVRFYDGLLLNMKAGQTVSDAMSESDVIALRDEVFAKPQAALRNAA